MALLRILIPDVTPQVPCRRGIWVTSNSVKLYFVPRFRLGIDLCMNIFGASYEADALQNNRLNNHLLGVTLTTSYAIELCRYICLLQNRIRKIKLTQKFIIPNYHNTSKTATVHSCKPLIIASSHISLNGFTYPAQGYTSQCHVEHGTEVLINSDK